MKNSNCSLNVPYLLALVFAIMALYIVLCRPESPALEGFRRRGRRGRSLTGRGPGSGRTNNQYVRPPPTIGGTKTIPARVRYTLEDVDWFAKNVRYVDIYPHVNKADSVKKDIAAQTASALGVLDDVNKFALLVEAMKAPDVWKQEFGNGKRPWRYYGDYENKLNNQADSVTLFGPVSGLTRMLRAYVNEKDHNTQTRENQQFKFPGNPTFNGVSIYP